MKGLLAGYDLTAPVFRILVNIILLVLGCLLEGSTIILVILPIFLPTVKALGIDPVHFGVIVVFNVMIGLVTPPYGLLLFIITTISGAPLRHIIRDTMPFVYAMIVALGIITYFPETVLWLPENDGLQRLTVSRWLADARREKVPCRAQDSWRFGAMSGSKTRPTTCIGSRASTPASDWASTAFCACACIGLSKPTCAAISSTTSFDRRTCSEVRLIWQG